MDKQNRTQQTENKQSEFDRSTAKERIDRIDPYGFERSEDFDYDHAILTRRSIKWSKLLKGNNKVIKKKYKRYVRKGIPNVHRSLIWMAASGAQAQLEQNPGYYRKLLEGERDPRLEDTIKTDMHRTFPDNVHFRKNAEPCLQHTLFNVLLAYGHHNTNVGYCQGMNFIVGYLILIKKDEEKSFWLLDALLGRILPGRFTVITISLPLCNFRTVH
ncbi:growth hormone-regulated TBC protein 1-like [Huso huso]|uniref:Growth hormone-regulated TBC protein 1-like n=1 Tax=Huso huso TaxID=61971 RepID=A0ABR0ZLP0_HUSHU